MTVTLTLNGRAVPVAASTLTPLLDVLRDELGDTTPKPGCWEGRCGACTVLLDGEPILSCVTPVARAADGAITTLEGLADGDELDPVQEAFSQLGAVQCGICTPGMILAVHALTEERPDATRDEIKEALVNNLCRCTGYTKILDAVDAVLAAPKEGPARD